MSWSGFPLSSGDAITAAVINQVIDAVRERQWAMGVAEGGLLARVASGDSVTYALLAAIESAINTLIGATSFASRWYKVGSWSETTAPAKYVSGSAGTGELNIFNEAFGTGTAWRETLGSGSCVVNEILNDWRLVLNKLTLIWFSISPSLRSRQKGAGGQNAVCADALAAVDAVAWTEGSQSPSSFGAYASGTWHLGYADASGLYSAYSSNHTFAGYAHVLPYWSVAVPAEISGVSVNVGSTLIGLTTIQWAVGHDSTEYDPARSVTITVRSRTGPPSSWSDAIGGGTEIANWVISAASSSAVPSVARYADASGAWSPGDTIHMTAAWSGPDLAAGSGLCSYVAGSGDDSALERLYFQATGEWLEFDFAFAP